MKRMLSVGVLALGLCACVQGGSVLDGSDPAAQAGRISFAVEPCFGFCPDFNLNVDANGQGIFEGENFVAARGTHQFSATPEQLAAFTNRLAEFRPEQSVSYGHENCEGSVMSDMPSVRVTWHDSDGSSTQLNWYMGCRQPGLAGRSNEIYRAWEELPIEGLVGADEERHSFGPS